MYEPCVYLFRLKTGKLKIVNAMQLQNWWENLKVNENTAMKSGEWGRAPQAAGDSAWVPATTPEALSI